MIVCTETIGLAWLASVEYVLSNGSEHFDEDSKIREVLGLSIQIKSPTLSDPIIAQYGDPKVLNNMLQKFEKGVVMNNRPFTYGQRIFDYKGIDQFEWLVDRLKNKKETKSATIILQEPGDTHPNQPCLTSLDAKIREGKLHLQFFFRSQNILGRQYANLIALAKLQVDLAGRLNVEVGSLLGYIASAHIYDYDINSASSILEQPKQFRIKDQFYSHGPRSIRESFQ
ncbi:thymidylate synthase [Paraferrimonas haliotis]|uniref:thymidylate synthase n=1 Tax=Paraferrimonas haliotis TaxID=2013866 RepID=UPI000BA9142B|nr:thymidylate synthase [Paraferrimonas haliotis]